MAFYNRPDQSRHDPYDTSYQLYRPLNEAHSQTSLSLYPSHDPSYAVSPASPFDDEHNRNRRGSYLTPGALSRQHSEDPADSRDTIPLTQQQPKYDDGAWVPPPGHHPARDPFMDQPRMEDSTGNRSRASKILRKVPWVVYTVTLIQVIVFVVEIIKNAQLTGSPIEIHPQFNPMIGPSSYVLINMGARYVPCMRNEESIQVASKSIQINFPCPNTTTNDALCSLTELCGMTPAVPDPNTPGLPHTLDQTPAPNQWWRFITPIFLHGGIIHIGANLILQIILGRDMERAIGPIRFFLVYFSSGIFGFVMGGNFAAPGIASTGCSGSLFGIIGLVFIDLLYTWRERRHPALDLIMMVVVVAISFVIGLLPSGTDNFSHIGGFIMGLVLGLCLLHSPQALRQRIGEDASEQLRKRRSTAPDSLVYGTVGQSTTTFFRSPVSFFKGRKPLWWAWWLVRVAALVAVLVAFIVLLNNFYKYRSNCSWCKYLSCLPVKNWCDVGNLTTTTTTAGPAGPTATSNARLALMF